MFHIGCSFFRWKDQPITPDKRELYFQLFRETQAKERQLWLEQKTEAPSEQTRDCKSHFCVECSRLLSASEADQHPSGSHVVKEINDTDMVYPSRLLFPHGDNKSHAQYFFSEQTLSFLSSELQRQGYTHLISLGTPTVHEAMRTSGHCKSFLLDIDLRYAQFYQPNTFQQFNMFNAFFYFDEGERHLQDFVKSAPESKLVMVVDPPFGGLVRAFSAGIKKIWSMSGRQIPTLLIFPYFSEAHVLEAFPLFKMLDYQVVYSNHKHYSKGIWQSDRSKPSPVRIFTNIPLPALQLPTDEGYRFCHKCNRYVCRLNRHCEKCNACTSKDGRTYVHCDECGICVKASWIHCLKCGRCEPLGHSCETRSTIGCHVCGAMDHKRRECPEKKRPHSSRPSCRPAKRRKI